jgi:hypothetical protein
MGFAIDAYLYLGAFPPSAISPRALTQKTWLFSTSWQST